MKKWKPSINRIALKSGENGNFTWKNFNCSMLLSCQRQHSANID